MPMEFRTDPYSIDVSMTESIDYHGYIATGVAGYLHKASELGGFSVTFEATALGWPPVTKYFGNCGAMNFPGDPDYQFTPF